MRFVNLIILLIVVFFGISFACLNAQSVRIDYYFGNSYMPLSLLLALALAIGTLLGLLVSMIASIRMRCDNHRMKRRLKLVEEEVCNLRNIPLKDNR